MLVSALLKGWWREIGQAVESGRVELLTSPQLVADFTRVAARPSLRPLIDEHDAAEIANLIRRCALALPNEIERICRDPNDDYLLALAMAGKADVLVTRDEDLLTLTTHWATEIIHVAEFLRRISPDA